MEMGGDFTNMNNYSKNILLITPGFPINEEDTTCIPALQEFVLGLNKYYPNLNISIVTLHYPSKQGNYVWHGNNVYSIGASNCGFPKRLFYWAKFNRLISKLHQKNNFDLVHSFWYDEVTFLTFKTAKKLNIKHFCTFMGQDALGENSYVNRIFMPRENLIALSPFQQKYIQESSGIRVDKLIPWGINESNVNLTEKTIDIVNIGSFNEVKNQYEAIQIIAAVANDLPSLKCLLVGDGPKRKKIEELVSTLGIEENVTFSGELSRPEVLDLLAHSKILLHSSNYESFGMIFPEALASNVMIVSKQVGIAHEDSYWKIYQTIDEAKNHVLMLLRTSDRPNHTSNGYSIKKTVDQYLKIWV